VNRALAPLAVALVLAAACAACGSSDPSGAPSERPPAAAAQVIGCLSINQQECELVATRVLAQLPAARGAPFAIIVELYGCPNMDNCANTLAVREGKVTIEWADPAEPVELSVKGPPAQPVFGKVPTAWSGLIAPASPRVAGAGPFPFQLGHCGLSWQVDFDASFWLPVGQVDGDASAIINSDEGEIRLLAPTLAEYRGGGGFVARLARFPGPKHVWLCA
jgi:hypothetical protein